MALIRLPELVCYNCKRPKSVTYHEDSSIRGTVCKDCPNRPPGPASYPQLFDKGEFKVEAGKEGLRVYSMKARAEANIRKTLSTE